MTDFELAAKIDHTLLKANATRADILRVCDEAKTYRTASVCVNTCWVPEVAEALAGSGVKTCCVVGFPLGAMSTAAKAFEAADAIKNGADEIDMVINLSMVKDGRWDKVAEDISAVREATKGYILKVIIECCLLTDEEKVKMCAIVADCGADYIKTSTGFSKGGATREDVKLMRENCPASVKVKAAGGISSIEDAEDFVALGADRLGTSRIVKLAMAMEQE